MIVGVPRETRPGERRVALVPAVIPGLKKAGVDVVVEAGAGVQAGYPDAGYLEKGARLVQGRAELFATADVIVQLRCGDPAGVRPGQTVIGFLDPLDDVQAVRGLAAAGATSFAMELIPRITRAQSMDALSAMATITGYKAVIRAAALLPRMFPMLTTAAGTIAPARVLVIGAGVAGLQAIATARRMGAVASAYDLRPAAREQVQSLGGRFVELPLEVADAQDARGYGKAQDESFYRRQRELLGDTVAASDVVIAAAVVPGKRAPVLVTREMVARMAPGSVIVDLAADRGGNCELTRRDETVVSHEVSIVGDTGLAASVPYHASQLYARNVSAFLLHLKSQPDPSKDEILRETLVTRGGEIANARVAEAVALRGAA